MKPELLKIWERKGECRIKSLSDFVLQTNLFMKPRTSPKLEVNRFLFRGESNSEWELLPTLPRSIGSNPKQLERPWLSLDLMYHIEEQSTAEFQRKARLYEDPRFLPSQGDTRAWWQLMQHHRAKTRLLDWSASPYVAAYFAVADNPTKDGAVWMVDHGSHSNRMEIRFPEQFPKDGPRTFFLQTRLPRQRIPGDPDPDTVAAILATSSDRVEQFHKAQAASHHSTSLAFMPCTIPNRRMSAQSGWFSCATLVDTHHGEAIATAFSGEEYDDRWWCQRLLIDSSAKCGILRDLWKMNITGETVYCGLDGLGKAMSELTDLLTPSDGCKYQLEQGLLSVEHNAAGGK